MLFKRYPSDYQLKKRGKKRIFLELERRIMSISYADSYFARESDSELLILVRSQFRPQFLFWSGRKNKPRPCKSKQACCGEMVLGSFVFCSCDSEFQFRFWTQKNSSQRALLLCLAPRRGHFARPWTQVSKPALTAFSLAAKRRAEALHVVFF